MEYKDPTYDHLFKFYAKAQNLPWKLLKAQAWQENQGKGNRKYWSCTFGRRDAYISPRDFLKGIRRSQLLQTLEKNDDLMNNL